MYKLETRVGDTIKNTLNNAKNIALSKNETVEFDFNGIMCIVDSDSNIEYAERDYSNSFLMKWKTIGPNYVEEYNETIKTEMNTRKIKSEEESEIRAKEYKEKQDKAKKHLYNKIKDIELDITDINEWNKIVEKNKDSYGSATIRYAEYWGKLMQLEHDNGKTISECVDSTSHDSDIEGVSGFMYNFALNLLIQYWKHGEELKNWHESINNRVNCI